MTTRYDLVSRLRDPSSRDAMQSKMDLRLEAASVLEAKDAEIARLKAGWNDCVSDLTAAQKRISDLERQLAEETERCARVAVARSEREREFQVSYMKNEKPTQAAEHCYGRVVADHIAAAIRGGAK